jgi:N-carbamoylputrescine amidase
MRKLTLAATQFACGPESSGNLDKAEALVRRAAAEGAEVILLQELFETPYFCKDQLASLFALARPAAANPILARFAGLARELGVVLPVSFFEQANNAHYNSVMVIDADGRMLGIYRKSHMSASAGTNGFRNAPAAWRSRAPRSCSIRRRSARNRRTPPSTAASIGAG